MPRAAVKKSTREQLGKERVLGSSVLLGHTEESAQGWVWQSGRPSPRDFWEP
eukprot:symbB.v1.2.019992.t1/scaffold1657.1/size107422/1